MPIGRRKNGPSWRFWQSGLSILVLALSAAPTAALEGRPLVVRIQPAIESYPQHFALHRTEDGLLFLATIGGVAIFDGETWDLIPLPDGQPARSLDVEHEPILVGAYDDFGLLRREADGRRGFTSLLGGFELSGPIGAVDQVLAHDGWLHFRTGEAVYSLRPADGTHRRHHEPTGLGPLAVHAGRLLLVAGDALVAFDPVTGTERLAAWPASFRAVEAVVDGGDLLFRDGQRGFLRWDGRRVAEIPLAEALPPGMPVIAMASLDDGWLALGTPVGDLLLAQRATGKVRRIPITDDRIDDLRSDPGGGLWALSHSELIHLEWPPTWERWRAAEGLRGTVNRVLETGDEVILATSAGVLRQAGRDRFELLDWAGTEAWDIAPWPGGGWIVAESPRLTWVTPAGRRVEVGSGLTPRILLSASGGGLWVGSNAEVLYLQADAEGEPTIAARYGGVSLVRSLAEGPDGSLWIGSIDGGVARLDRRTDSLVPFPIDGVTRGGASVSRVGAQIWIARDGQVLAWNGANLAPVEGLTMPPMGGLDFTVRAAEESDGTVWAANYHTVLRRRPSGWHPAKVDAYRRGAFNWIGAASGGGMWIGATGALYRYQPRGSEVARTTPATLLRAVGSDDPDWPRLPLRGGDPPVLSPRSSVSFRYALPSFDGPARTTYRTRLLGQSDTWSPWRAEASASFPGLPAGDYRFEVQARSGSGMIAAPVPYVFSVAPAPHETPAGRAALVIAIALVGFGAAVMLARLRTRRLQEHNRMLDALVQDRTAALENANRRLRQLAERDGLTGIANRRVFEEELATATSHPPPPGKSLGLLLADADHFKRFNDAHGHLAGDQLLRDIAALIEVLAAEQGGLAARYGGEEFAILLADTDHLVLRDLAEDIRQAVARETEATISIGGAMAAPGATPQDLISAADEALYAAKDAGRNRVAFGA